MNVEEIDAHVDAHLNAEVVNNSSMSESQLKLFNICSVLQAAKPVLKFARGFLFFKPKWQAIIDKVLAVIETVCPE